MRCREARQRLSELTDFSNIDEEDEALHQHLKECAKCERLARVGQLLRSDIDQVRTTQSFRPMTVEQVREEIAIRESLFNEMNPGVRIMRQANDILHRRPRVSIVSAALVVVLIASVFVPVKTEYPTGYEVAFAAPVDSLILNSVNGERMLAMLDIENASIALTETESGIEYKIAPLRDSAQVQKLMSVIDSLGGRSVSSSSLSDKSRSRTIWQLLLESNGSGGESSFDREDRDSSVTLNLGKIGGNFEKDFTLWMPVGEQYADSMTGLLFHRQGNTTDIKFVGTGSMRESSNDCGWNDMLNGNTEMMLKAPDGSESTYDLTNIDDVRRLEKMGYNFYTMKFDTPGQVPIPGMGPELVEIKSSASGEGVQIKFMVPRAYEVSLRITDSGGRVIRTLLDCISLAGIYHSGWNGLDDDGIRVSPGTYLCRFDAGDYSETRPVVIGR